MSCWKLLLGVYADGRKQKETWRSLAEQYLDKTTSHGNTWGTYPLSRRAFPSPVTMVEMQQDGRSGWRRAAQPQHSVCTPGTFIRFSQTHKLHVPQYERQADPLPKRKERLKPILKSKWKKQYFFFLPALHPHQAWPAKAEPSCFKPGPHVLTPEFCLHSHSREEEDPAGGSHQPPFSHHLYWVLLTSPKNAFAG